MSTSVPPEERSPVTPVWVGSPFCYTNLPGLLCFDGLSHRNAGLLSKRFKENSLKVIKKNHPLLLYGFLKKTYELMLYESEGKREVRQEKRKRAKSGRRVLELARLLEKAGRWV